MGVYVYTLRKDTKPAKLGAKSVELARADFAFKETLSSPRHHKAALTKAATARDSVGPITYVVIGNWENGAPVRKVSENWYAGVDTPSLPGELVGELVKIKRGRHVFYSVRRLT